MFIDLVCPIITNVTLDFTSLSLTHIKNTLKKHTLPTNVISNLNRSQHHLGRVSSKSTTLSSSSSSNHSPFSPMNQISTSNTTTTMDDVWKDINLSSITHPADATKGCPGFILKDFLAKPFSSNGTNKSTGVSSSGYGSPPPPPVSQPPMLLNLNSGPDQPNFLAEDPTRNVDVPFNQANSSSGLLPHSIGGMRMLPATNSTGGDRRHKRMIKNRESAARSRARKQAYTNEMEDEVERLIEENTRLKRHHQQQLRMAAAQMTKKEALRRTLSAPF